MKLSPLLFGLALPLVSSVASAEIESVKSASANFREQPSDKGSIVYSADKFYPVEILERKNGWALVRDFEGDKAWVAERSLGKTQTIVVQTEHANIRDKASTDSEVLFKVEHGEVFKVEERKEQWLKVVDAHGDGGWIRADMTWGLEDGAKADEKAEKLEKKSEKLEKSERAEKSEKKSEKAKVDDASGEARSAEAKSADEKSDEHCTCRKADEERAEKKVDLTDKREKADKSERKAEKKADSKAKSADDDKPTRTDHEKKAEKKSEKKAEHAKPSPKAEKKAEHDKPHHK